MEEVRPENSDQNKVETAERSKSRSSEDAYELINLSSDESDQDELPVDLNIVIINDHPEPENEMIILSFDESDQEDLPESIAVTRGNLKMVYGEEYQPPE